MSDINIDPISEKISLEAAGIDLHNNPIDNISAFSLNQTYINSRECPHCGSHDVLSNGNYKKRKRYLCKDCGKSYNDLTKTPFSGIHNLNKIMSYLNSMISGDSIRKAALTVNISVSTSFNWRHKLLNGLNQLPAPRMKNVKEIVELEVPYSHKGQKSKPTELKRKSTLSALFVCDRTGRLDSDSVTYSNRENNPLLARIRETSNEHTDLICSTNFNNINDFSEVNIKANHSAYSQPTLINQIISLWHTWMKRFRGVASKYLSNYLHWFDYLDNSLSNSDRAQDLLRLLLKH